MRQRTQRRPKSRNTSPRYVIIAAQKMVRLVPRRTLQTCRHLVGRNPVGGTLDPMSDSQLASPTQGSQRRRQFRLSSLFLYVLLVAAVTAALIQSVQLHEANIRAASAERLLDELTGAMLDLGQLKTELKNRNYVWNGPTTEEDRIPLLHAARALAFIGDDAVPILIDAAKDPQVDIHSIYDALAEIGIPVHHFWDDIMDRKMEGVENWWRENAESTRSARSEHRESIGLPSVR